MTLPWLCLLPFISGNFSTGSDSPVSDAWLTNRSFDSMMRMSAGIMSPAARQTTSPGTNSVISTSSLPENRFTKQVFLTIFINESVASLAFHSCQKRRMALQTTIEIIIRTAVHSRSSGRAITTSMTREMTASAVNTPINGLMNVRMKSTSGFFFCSREISFLP